jgi:hypothetical protein
MFRTRFWMAVAVLVLTLGPLLATAGYGLYLRSGMYVNSTARRASVFLGAPVQIGGIVPLDSASQALRDVSVWLPGEFSPIFTCKSAVVRLVGSQCMEIDLRDGRIEARTDEWNRETLWQLLAMAFGHDFNHILLKTVRLENMDLVARRGRAAVWASGASGQVDLSGDGGRADLVCDGLNGVRTSEPVRFHCEFEPGAKPLVRELSVSVQRLGVEAFASGKAATAGDRGQRPGTSRPGATASTATAPLKRELRTQAEAGTPNIGPAPLAVGTPHAIATATGSAPAGQAGGGSFSGRIVYRQKSRAGLAGVVELSGNLVEVDLAALNPPGCKTKLAGIVSGTLDRMVLDEGQIGSIEGRLRVEGLDLKGLLGLAGWPAAEGTATLDLHELRYEAGVVQALLAEAEVRDLDVEPLVQPLRSGSIRGRLSATLQKIKIVDGCVEELAGEARVAPPTGQDGTIDRSILEAAMQQLCSVSLPPILPEKVPYTEFAARFHCEGDDLHIEGAAGPQEKFILVVGIGSVPLPLVPAPPGPIALGPLRAYAAAQIDRLARVLTEAGPWGLARR